MMEVTVAYTGQLRHNLYNSLMSPAARQIDFWVQSIHVDACAFLVVFVNLLAGSIDIAIERLPGRQTNAIYSRERNAFLFRQYDYGDVVDQKAVMIHESVHAFTDIRSMVWSTYFVDEVAGYIAEMLFLRYSLGKSVKQSIAELNARPETTTMTLEPHEAAAADIADTIAGKQGAFVSSRDIDRLTALIHNHPDYRNIPLNARSGANGVL
jgi:hypothetical protein